MSLIITQGYRPYFSISFCLSGFFSPLVALHQRFLITFGEAKQEANHQRSLALSRSEEREARFSLRERPLVIRFAREGGARERFTFGDQREKKRAEILSF